MRIEKNTFSIKISQRIFSTFVTCALVPVCCVALMAYFTVTRHLEAQTLENLRHAAKSLAKTINDRLQLMANELQLIGSVTPDQRRVNDHPHSGWLGFYRHRREKTGARSAPVVAGETGCEAPG